MAIRFPLPHFGGGKERGSSSDIQERRDRAARVVQAPKPTSEDHLVGYYGSLGESRTTDAWKSEVGLVRPDLDEARRDALVADIEKAVAKKANSGKPGEDGPLS